MGKRQGGRPNVKTRRLEPVEIDDSDERVPVAEKDLTSALMEAVLVDEVRDVTNNTWRDENGKHFWTMSFAGGGSLVLIYSLPDQRFLDWDYDGVRFERIGGQLFVLSGAT